MHDCADWDVDTHLLFLAERAWRLILAHFDDDAPSMDLTLAEVDGCPVCLARLTRYLVGAFVGLADTLADRERLIRQAERELAQILAQRR